MHCRLLHYFAFSVTLCPNFCQSGHWPAVITFRSGEAKKCRFFSTFHFCNLLDCDSVKNSFQSNSIWFVLCKYLKEFTASALRIPIWFPSRNHFLNLQSQLENILIYISALKGNLFKHELISKNCNHRKSGEGSGDPGGNSSSIEEWQPLCQSVKVLAYKWCDNIIARP